LDSSSNVTFDRLLRQWKQRELNITTDDEMPIDQSEERREEAQQMDVSCAKISNRDSLCFWPQNSVGANLQTLSQIAVLATFKLHLKISLFPLGLRLQISAPL
jgi:hypothetical protein